ncbi:hypothetical protein ASPCAL07737 [Aspergillus calidoustus]|uniref:Uncharacterized protein n=1 Tax=Aspergillus calidoustus TaxID=454130 RepID=A0A0U5GPI7_ASPCI|nr:hypothetical protein ASPCAL07737 [Aspergillus calidoustus]
MAKDAKKHRGSSESDEVYTLGSSDDEAQLEPERKPRRSPAATTRTRPHRTAQREKAPIALAETNGAPSDANALQPRAKGETQQVAGTGQPSSAMRIQGSQNPGIHEAPKKKEDTGLKLRLDLNLDIEVELKAKIYGDLTLALLS